MKMFMLGINMGVGGLDDYMLHPSPHRIYAYGHTSMASLMYNKSINSVYH